MKMCNSRNLFKQNTCIKIYGFNSRKWQSSGVIIVNNQQIAWNMRKQGESEENNRSNYTCVFAASYLYGVQLLKVIQSQRVWINKKHICTKIYIYFLAPLRNEDGKTSKAGATKFLQRQSTRCLSSVCGSVKKKLPLHVVIRIVQQLWMINVRTFGF